MDWGLFDAKAGDNRFLREEIVYSSTVSACPCSNLRTNLHTHLKYAEIFQVVVVVFQWQHLLLTTPQSLYI